MSALAHRVDGPADAPALVLSNSIGTDMTLWEPQLATLATRFRVVRYDTRGQGGSPVVPGDCTLTDLVADLTGLLDTLGIARASFAGVSLGGMTAMALAGSAPERVERLVLCCTSARLGPPDMWRERAAAVRAGGMGAVARATVGRWFTPAADPAVAARFETILRAMPAEGYAGCCAAIRDMDLRPRLATIAAPALVIAAAEDPSTPPAHGAVIAGGIPGARSIVLEHGAHLANVERAEEVTAAMLEHLDP